MKIAIIGGGASAVCSLDQIIEQAVAGNKQSAITEISIFEKGDKFARGLAYDTENILNMRNETMYVRPGEPSAYRAFALKAGMSAQGYAERRFFGSYLDEHFTTVLKKAQEYGIPVILRNRSEVTDLDRNAGRFMLQVNGDAEYTYDKVLLCTGNQNPVYGRALIGTPGYFHKSYDVESIAAAIPKDQDVLLLGSGLASIDAFLSLQKRGYSGKITFASRNGILPKVRTLCEPYTLKYLSADNLLKHTVPGGTKLSFAEMADLFLKELTEANVDISMITAEMQRVQDSSPIEALKGSLAQAEFGSQGYFHVLKAVDEVAGVIWNSMSEEAQAHFDTHYKRLWDVFDYPMPPENARKLIEAMEHGKLEVIGGIKTIKYDALAARYVLEKQEKDGEMQEIQAQYVINTTGPGYDLDKVDNRLLQSLYTKGILKAHPRGGIDVDYLTGRAKMKDGNMLNDLYVIGSLTRGVHFYTNSLTENAKAAQRAVSALIRHLPKVLAKLAFNNVKKPNQPKIALFVGSDISSQLLLNELVPAMNNSGYEPVIFLPRHKPSAKIPPQDLQDLAFYERRMTNEVIYPFMNAAGIQPGTQCHTPEQLAKVYNIRVEELDNINDPDFIRSLIDDEMLQGGVSIRCYQKFMPEIIGVFEEKGFLWNLHPGILPEYQGVMTLIRAMANRESSTSYTLHAIDTKWDGGPVLDVRPQPLALDKPMLSNYCDLAPSGVPIIIENIDRFFSGTIQDGLPQDPAKTQYYTFPTPQELASYRTQGIRLVDAEDMAGIYMKLFRSTDKSFNEGLKACIIKAITDWENTKLENKTNPSLLGHLDSHLNAYIPE